MAAPTEGELMRTNAILARYPELHQLAAVMLEQMNKGCIRKAWSLSRYISDHTDYETLPLLTQAEVQRVIATGEYIFNLNDLGMSAFKTATSLAQSVSDDDTQSEPARVEARETLSRIRFFSELCEEKSRAWKDRRVREKAPREAHFYLLHAFGVLEDDADEPNDGHVIYAHDWSESVGMFEGSNMEMGSPQPASFYPEDQGEPLPVPPKRVQPVRTEI